MLRASLSTLVLIIGFVASFIPAHEDAHDDVAPRNRRLGLVRFGGCKIKRCPGTSGQVRRWATEPRRSPPTSGGLLAVPHYGHLRGRQALEFMALLGA
jgi:hypothetical protein